MVSGTLPSEGKTTTAINLAIGISQDVSQTVLLVDCDLGRPAIARCLGLGLQSHAGLSNYLKGDVEVRDIIYHTDVDRLLILPNFQAMSLSESLVSPRMVSLLEHIKMLGNELLVIFDMPPVLVSDSVLAFAPHVDALLLVVAEGRTNRTLLKRATQMVEDVPRVGTVLNRSSEGNAGGYY
jgi:Mrp family chromosome partitioning ATPase